MKIAVIGGGITGLTAAYVIGKRRHQVTLFEGSEDLGGLAAGIPFHGTTIEKTYHHLFRSDQSIIALARELGIADTLQWRRSSTGVCWKKQFFPLGSARDLLTFPGVPFFQRIRLGLVIAYLRHRKSPQHLTRVSAHRWMQRWCGKSAYRVLWEPLLKGKFHDAYQTVSMRWLWARIHVRAQSRARASEELGYFTGGFSVLVEALRRDIEERGSSIRLATPVDTLMTRRDESGIELRYGQEREHFDRVLCTIPSDAFARLIEGHDAVPASTLRQLRSVSYLGAVCLLFSSTQDLSPFYWTNCLDEDAPFVVFIQHTKFIPSTQYRGKHVYYMGVYVPHDHPTFVEDEGKTQQKFFAYVKSIRPEFHREDVDTVRVFRLRNAQHIVDTSYEEKIPPYQTPVPGVFLANFSQIFPQDRGTNFAVEEGRKVATILLQS